MKYQKPRFTVPATENNRQTPCAIHHFDRKGQCLRCPVKATHRADDRSLLNGEPVEFTYAIISQPGKASRVVEFNVSEGAE